MTSLWLAQSLAFAALFGGVFLALATAAVLPLAWLAGWLLGRAGRPVPLLRWAGWGLGTLWVCVAALFGAGLVMEELYRREYRRYHYALPETRTMEGLALPARTWVDLDPSGALLAFRPPDGTAVVVAGIRWTEAVQWRDGMVTSGLPLDPVVRDGVPCAPGRFVTDWGGTGRLQTCTLDGDRDFAGVPCSGGGEVAMAEQPPGTLAACRLRTAHRVGGLACAAGVAIRFDQGALTHCTLAEVAERNGMRLPPGTAVILGIGPWGLVSVQGPEGTPLVVLGVPMLRAQVVFQRDGAVQQVRLPFGEAVAMGRGQVSGLLRYGEAGFEQGTLAAPLLVDGRMLEAGEEVGRRELGLE